jgi:hypothetical protein
MLPARTARTPRPQQTCTGPPVTEGLHTIHKKIQKTDLLINLRTFFVLRAAPRTAFPHSSAFPNRFHFHIFSKILADILIFTSVAGLRLIRELGFDRDSFRVPARVKEGGFLAWEVGSSMGM